MNSKYLSLAICLVFIASCGTESNLSGKRSKRGETPKGDERVSKLLSSGELGEVEFNNWHNLDLEQSDLFGVSTDKAYSDFQLKQKAEVIVAVIDSGVDYLHEDLKDVMWINEKEIPNDGIDNDGNGYIDDVHGWNFLGGADGRNIDAETLEETRIYRRLLAKIQNGGTLTSEEDTLFVEVRDMVEDELKYFKDLLNMGKSDQKLLTELKAKLKELTGITLEDTKEAILAITSTESEVLDIKKDLLNLWNKNGSTGFARIIRVIDFASYYVDYGYNVDFDPRSDIAKDDPSDFSDKNYGNNDVKGPDSSHGTHVSGIIAAKRNNGIGMNGIANNVKIMALRAVPNGDERDKDIALAVRYAADNGAKIINMSFAKKFSPYKSEVDKAFKYAASKGVLLVHAAGNDARNTDKGDHNYPNTYIKDGFGVLQVNSIPNWIEVGASTRFNNINLVAEFSNYGNENVTLFAPGHKIYSTTPEDTYAAYNGTSMACPVTAGVAALLMSEYPTMIGSEAKDLLLESVVKPNMDVRLPSDDSRTPDFRLPIPFANLSTTDGVLNAYNVIELAKFLAETK